LRLRERWFQSSACRREEAEVEVEGVQEAEAEEEAGRRSEKK